jgi:Z1 domain/Type III restriction enzyme, res subunit
MHVTLVKKNGLFFEKFLNDSRYGHDDINVITKTVQKLIDSETNIDRPGMLLGRIQSGKTKTFIAIIALAFDNGFDGAVILTKGTKALSKQTVERITKEFKDFTDREMLQPYDVMTMPKNLTGYEINQKLVFVAKKQPDNMDRLFDAFSNPVLSEKRFLIVDDEADYASIGFKKTKEEGVQINTTTSQIDSIRKLIKKSSFLQVTATPYSLYLQPESIKVEGIEFKPIKPAFTELVPVNKDYVGGDYYFNDALDIKNIASHLYIPITRQELEILHKPDRRKFKIEEVLKSNAISSLRLAIIGFVVGGCIRRLQDQYESKDVKKYSFLIHTESNKNAHAWQEDVVNELYDQLSVAIRGDDSICNKLFLEAYSEFVKSIELEGFYLPPVAEVVDLAKTALTQEWLMITKVNSEKQIEELLDADGQLKLRTPFNIFIGGQILDRGITIANLIGFYYGRRPKVYQQDTVLQHSRMYGFRPKNDLAVTRFYTEPGIYQAMKAMHECDSALRSSFENSDGDQAVVFIQKDVSGLVRPCSPNKILLSRVTTLRPYKRILPIGFQTIYPTYLKPIVASIDKKLHDISGESEEPFLIDVNFAVEIIRDIQTTLESEINDGYHFDWDATESIVRYLSQLASDDLYKGKVWCLVRKDRNLSRTVSAGSHALYSDAPDTTRTEGVIAKQTAINNPMLMLIRQNGSEERGWRGSPFYWPVIYTQLNVKTAIFSSETTD